MVTVSGAILSPLGEPIQTTIRVTCVENGSKLVGLKSTLNTSEVGEYSFTLSTGKYYIEVLEDGWAYLPTAIVEVPDLNIVLPLEQLIKEYGTNYG